MSSPKIVKSKPIDLPYTAKDLEIIVQCDEERHTLYFRLDSKGSPRRYCNQQFGETKLSKKADEFVEKTYEELSSLADRIPEIPPKEIEPTFRTKSQISQ